MVTRRRAVIGTVGNVVLRAPVVVSVSDSRTIEFDLSDVGAGSEAAFGHCQPVGLVEHHLAHVPDPVWPRRPGRVVVVEAQEGALAIADLEEAHHTPLV